MMPLRLKELRIKRQLTQEQLAEMLGLATRTISSWEIGDRKPTIDMIIRLAGFYEVSADYILGLSDNPSTKTHESNNPNKSDLRENAKTEEFAIELPFGNLHKDDQALAQALEPILEPLVRKLLKQHIQRDNEE